MSEQAHVDAVIAELISNGATGALEVKSGKKRWLFFFSGGALVFTRSNLKSEQSDAIRQKAGDVPTNELIRLQAVRRLRNALRADVTEQSFHEGAAPPQVTPVNAIGVLFSAIKAAFRPEVLARRVAPLLTGFPRVEADLGGLGFDPSLEGYLQSIDGGRPGQDIVDFGPASPAVLHAALLCLWLLGDLKLSDSAVDMATVMAVGGSDDARPQPPAAAKPAPSELGDDLFADAVSSPVVADAPSPARAPAPAAPLGAEDGLDLGALMADIVAGEDRQHRGDAPSPPAPEARPVEDQAMAAVDRPTAGAHPLAERLHALARRMRHATNHFELLDVAWESPPSEFRRAYTDLARELHPDRYHDGDDDLKELATELFDEIRVAWEVLGNDAKRDEYIDITIHGKKSAEEEAMDQLNAYWAADDAFKKGKTIFRNGRIREAHDLFRQAAEAMPDELEFQAYFGYTTFALNQRGDPAAAEVGLSMLRGALERNKTQERQLDSAWALLGRAYRERGENETARRALVQALRINPANDAALREMRRLEGSPGKGPGGGPGKGTIGSFIAGLFGRK